jgi:O-methyltransferase domain/Dimerisation domain
MEPDLPTRMIQLITGAWAAQAVCAAATLGVADELANGPRRVEAVADAIGADADALHRLLRALAGLGLVEETADREFTLTELGELLTTDAPNSLRGIARMLGSPWHRRAWTDLAESVRSGESAFVRLFGDSWEYFRDHPADGEVFNDAMTATSGTLLAPGLSAYDFTRFARIVDVGGGHGALLAGVLAGHDAAQGVLYDLPEVIAGAGAPLERAGVADRCELVGGSFLDAVPAGGDAYLLANIIHDCDDRIAVRILRNCSAAMNPGGRVLLCEAVMPEKAGEAPQASLIDLEMLVMAPGARQRTAGEFERLFESAGLRLVGITAVGDTFSVVETEAA